MPFFTVAFLLGDLYLQNLSHLPSLLTVIVGSLGILFILWIGTVILTWPRKLFSLLAAMWLGFIWTGWYASKTLYWTLPKSIEGKNILIQGRVASLVFKEGMQQRFDFALNKPSVLIRLSQRNPDTQYHVGETWQFLVRLKQIHGNKNPGGFDYEAWALQKKLRASGYILESPANKLLKKSGKHFLLDQLREKLATRLTAVLPLTPIAKWLKALVLGIRKDILPEDWQILRKTGTNHLMVIAGLHIGLLAGFAYFIGLFAWRQIPSLLLYLPAPQAAAICALLVGVSYSALAGLTIPTQRACLMLSIFMLSTLLHKRISASYALSLAMLIVLILNPLVVITESFLAVIYDNCLDNLRYQRQTTSLWHMVEVG